MSTRHYGGTTAPTTPARDHEQARQELRRFARFVAQHDPEALAGVVENVPGTLAALARLDIWLRRYTAAIRRVRPQ